MQNIIFYQNPKQDNWRRVQNELHLYLMGSINFSVPEWCNQKWVIITRFPWLLSILLLFFPFKSLFRASWGTGRARTRTSSCSSSTRWTTCSPAASLPPIFSRPSGGRLVHIVIIAPIALIFIYFGQKQSTNIFHPTIPDVPPWQYLRYWISNYFESSRYFWIFPKYQ